MRAFRPMAWWLPRDAARPLLAKGLAWGNVDGRAECSTPGSVAGWPQLAGQVLAAVQPAEGRALRQQQDFALRQQLMPQVSPSASMEGTVAAYGASADSSSSQTMRSWRQALMR